MEFSMALRGNFSNLSLNDKNNPNFTILIQNVPSVQKLTQNDFEYMLSSRNFFQGGGTSTVMQISFVMLIFLLFTDQILGGRRKIA